MSKLLSGISRLDINFTTGKKEVSGFVRLGNSDGQLSAKGHVNFFSGNRIDFSGKIRDGVYDLEIRPHRGIFKAKGLICDNGTLTSDFNIYHLNVGGHDIVCDGTIKSEITSTGAEVKRSIIQGNIETKNFVLNYKPFVNLKAVFKVSDGYLEVIELNLADIIKGFGAFQLREPFNVNSVITANNLSLSWLALALGAKDASSILTGTANAKFEFKGPASSLRSNINLDVKKGSIATLEFENLYAHIRGDGAIMRIEDCRITRESGFFIIAGDIDLSKIGKSSLFENIGIVGDDKAINWDGWHASKVQNVSEITMKKRINDDLSLKFKKVTSEDTIDESLKYGDEVQLEYKLNPNDSLTMQVGQDNDFMGIEHKNKF